MHEGTWTIGPCPHRMQAALAEALGISELTASVLVRRGYTDPAEARIFLEGEVPPHDPFSLGDMRVACDRIRAAVAEGRRICVHGDYDVDGIAATTLAVLLLRELGAEVDWHLPSRFDEGYGVNRATLERLSEEGCGLVLTVDCGITAVEEVAEAKARGLEVIVTDHHRPRTDEQGAAVLPDCPIVATRPSDYPFPELCGTGVVYKLGQALFGVDSGIPKRHLDLVALATIADVVPLLDENRSMVIAGLRALARTQKIGLQALMRVAGVDPAAIDAGAVGFRLGPRINAAGRLGHPGDALELLLTDDPDDARRLASSLEDRNKERQAVEGRIVREAIAQVESWPEEHRARRAYVVAGEDWHEGVIGIVASRLVEKFNRPVVLIAGAASDSGEGGDWKGSGRSIPSFDLHGGLGACSELLERWGGHRAAAGLSIKRENVAAFAAAFAEHAAGLLLDEDLAPVTQVDAIVPRGRRLTLDLCAELARLAPFGLGNPAITLLAAGCELDALSTVGEGKHLRFRVRRDGTDAGSAIAFGIGPRLDSYSREGRWDVAFRLEENRWNGTVSPQLVVRRIFGADTHYDELREWLVAEFRKPAAARSADAAAVFAELEVGEAGLGRRHLLESEHFRALLASEPAFARAA
jgi:single-stranded-DNA-specific exonuclease